MRTSVFSLFFAVIAVAFLSTAADARPQHGDDGGSLDQILPQIRSQHPGTLYGAEGPFIGPDGQRHYRLKWMTPDGRVIWFDANARTGRVNNNGGSRDYNDEDRSYRDNRGEDDGVSGGDNRGHKRGDRFNGDGDGNPFDGGNGDQGGGRRRHDDNGNWNNPGNGWNGGRGGRGDRDGGGFSNPFGGGGGDGDNHRHHGHGHDN